VVRMDVYPLKNVVPTGAWFALQSLFKRHPRQKIEVWGG